MVAEITMIMKTLFHCLLALVFMASAGAVPAVVDRVLDGDTFAARVLLEDESQITVRVRLLDVDTPEISGQCSREINMAHKAKSRTAELLPVGSVVNLTEIKDDKYLGRIDARVRMADGRDLSEGLVKEKLGRIYDGGRRKSWCK